MTGRGIVTSKALMAPLFVKFLANPTGGRTSKCWSGGRRGEGGI